MLFTNNSEPPGGGKQGATSNLNMNTGSNTQGNTQGTTSNLNTGSNTQSKTKVNYQYQQTDQGPYRVMVELIDTQDGNIRINKLTLANVLRKMIAYKTHIMDMKNIGRNKVMVYLNNFQLANRLTSDENIKAKNYRAYIPRHLISVTGVIAGIPLDITEEDIMEDIICDYPVMQVYRMNRFVNGQKEPTQRMSITFRASKLPESIKIFHCSLRVRAFFKKAVLCLKCLRYNHKQENCKGKRRCEQCSKMHDNDEEFQNCQNPQRCLHCRKEHKTTDQTCPERTRQNNIQAILARTSLTTVEVIEQFPIHTQNYYESLVESAQDPTPTESFAEVTTQQYKPRNNGPNASRRKRDGVSPSSNNIGEQVVIFREKKQKVSSEGQQNGIALYNKYKTSDAERWKTQLRQAQQMRNQEENKQPTPSSSNNILANGAATTESEDFSMFVLDMISQGKINANSLEFKNN